MSKGSLEREQGEQPLKSLLVKHGLKNHDLVAASSEQITHKMVARACKGRLLTPHVQEKILRAFNTASGTTHTLNQIFNYSAPSHTRNPDTSSGR